jgi:hypothetical protein
VAARAGTAAHAPAGAVAVGGGAAVVHRRQHHGRCRGGADHRAERGGRVRSGAPRGGRVRGARSGCSATATCCERSPASSRSPPCSCSSRRVRRCLAPPSHPHATCCCWSRSVHRLGRRRAPQVGDPDPVLAARAGRHTSTRRLTVGRTSNEYGSRKAPSDSVASTRWPLAAVAGVLRGAWQSATSSVGGATH